MHQELNFGDKKIKNIPKYNPFVEKGVYDFFIKVHFSSNLSIFSHLFYGIIKYSRKCLY